ncbi:hypothetical protein E2C01_036573 [Portunus trituberculatus]|uniref:Uncharacterized protein n=1 Tax=Portunus trituberculatus TaxID=210409 RepID=A0A5B7FCF5_PORTR|nr:hypothetical protein [Portunus trituberculatus]
MNIPWRCDPSLPLGGTAKGEPENEESRLDVYIRTLPCSKNNNTKRKYRETTGTAAYRRENTGTTVYRNSSDAGNTENTEAEIPVFRYTYFGVLPYRHRITSGLTSTITDAFEQCFPLAWWYLLFFPYLSPLAKIADLLFPLTVDFRPNAEATSETGEDRLSRRVCRKCADGNIRVTLRLLTTSDALLLAKRSLMPSTRNITLSSWMTLSRYLFPDLD